MMAGDMAAILDMGNSQVSRGPHVDTMRDQYSGTETGGAKVGG